MITEKQKLKLVVLNAAKEKLKKEFFGIDDIIDSLISKITPWYITPEILDKPLVISLWGLTGTGKTSIVRKLINYLDISEKSIYFDCGEFQDSQTNTISSQLSTFFEDNENEISDSDPFSERETTNAPRDNVFVFDEFQYSRTLNEVGEEVNKAALRAVWNLMDHGIIDLVENNWNLSTLLNYLDELELFHKAHPGLLLEKGNFPKETTEEIKDTYSYTLYDNYHDLQDLDPNNPLYPVIPKNKLKYLSKILNKTKYGSGYDFTKLYFESTDLDSLMETLSDIKKRISAPRIINCSKSLIFVIGNLDSAFEISKELDPDIDADVFRNITSDVSIIDIKESLKGLFRAEQIGRLGNNALIYPSLRKKDFKKIIESELEKKSNNFFKISGIKLEFSQNFKDLVYSEGVYPSQGVRPLYSTINSFVGGNLSDIIQNSLEETKVIIFDTDTPDFNQKSINLTFNSYTLEGKINKTWKTPINLELGRLRSPEICSKLPLHSIHEASHSVAYTYLTGKLPEAIVAQSSSGGGFMYKKNDPSQKMSASSIKEVDDEIIVDLAGYYGECHFFPEEYRTLGSSSDIRKAWDLFSEAVYNNGYFDPTIFASATNVGNSGTALGIMDDYEEEVFNSEMIQKKLKDKYGKLQEKTKEIIKENEKLILEVAKELTSKRSLSTEEYKEIYKKYNKIEEKSFDYYSIFK